MIAAALGMESASKAIDPVDRFILRRQDDSGPDSDRVAAEIAESGTIRVLDQGRRYFYVLAEENALAALASHLSGWTVSAQQTYPRPDAGPVLKRIARRA